VDKRDRPVLELDERVLVGLPASRVLARVPCVVLVLVPRAASPRAQNVPTFLLAAPRLVNLDQNKSNFAAGALRRHPQHPNPHNIVTLEAIPPETALVLIVKK
jgi:hypothetical protein